MITTQAATQYTILAGEFPAVQTLLRFQEQYGYGAPAPNQDAYCAAIGDLLIAYPQVQNSLIKGWFEKMFSYLNTTATINSDVPVPVFYMLWNYKNFCNRQNVLEWKYNDPNNQSQWTSYWHTFVNGQEVLYDAVGGLNPSVMPRITEDRPTIGGWAVPSAPSDWHDTISAKITAWGDSPPVQSVNNLDIRFQVMVCIVLANGDCHPYNENAANGMPVYYQQTQLLNNWQNFSSIAAQTPAAIAASQISTASDLLKPSTLEAETYFFFLHLLIGLGPSNQAGQQLAAKIVSATTSSVEYPNDSFANQLVYLVLMYLIDPLGDFGWTNAKLQTTMSDLSKLITNQDAASTAVKKSLDNHLKILISDPSYPMQDPYCPNIGFNTRQADTLEALDSARQSIKP